jgi:hypothetical protein
MIVETASQLGLLEVGSNVFVRHLLHARLQKIVLLFLVSRCNASLSETRTSSSDQDLLPPADILRTRMLELEEWVSISASGERI